jgi:Type I phosphodiesterase / nucleotide pyrophosphatase
VVNLPERDPRVDDLRQRLRALGYLEAGVDRFVLGPARASRPPSSIAFLASLRIGALAAVLLGPAAAIGLSARLPGLVTGARDALLVAIYIGVFFGLAVAAGALTASLLVAWIARRRGDLLVQRASMLSRIAGGAVTFLCLAYLTLWWQTVIAGIGWSAPVWTASALVVAVAISLLLGHAVTVGSSAVVLAHADAGTQASRAGAGMTDPRRSTRASRLLTTLGAGVVAFAGAALLLTWFSGSSRTQDAAPALTVVSGGFKVRAIAIDGVDTRVFDELSSAGRLPALSAVFKGPTVQLASVEGDAADPARAWTTVATGQPSRVHGVRGLETRRLAGIQGSVPAEEGSAFARTIRGVTDLVRLTRPSIASGAERRSKTFWEVAATAGLRTAVVNWWATWPATATGGAILTDRATLRLEHGGLLDAEIAPPSLYESLRSRWPALKDRARSLATAALPATGDVPPLLQRSAELDAVQLVLLSEIAANDVDLAAVYLPGLDIAQHALLEGESQDASGRVAASTLAQRLDALRSYYAALDRLVAPLLTPNAGEIVIVVTGPGRVTTSVGGRLAARGGPMGSGAASQTPLRATTTEIAPTILYALGVPIARDLAAKPLVRLFTPEFTGRYPVRDVASYGRPSAETTSRQGQPLDQEMIERMRSLGYVR